MQRKRKVLNGKYGDCSLRARISAFECAESNLFYCQRRAFLDGSAASNLALDTTREHYAGCLAL